MRPSSVASRVSHNSQGASQAKLTQKLKEYEAVAALDKVTQLIRERIEGIEADCDVMAEAGEGICYISNIFQ